jgi:hypothetical protein
MVKAACPSRYGSIQAGSIYKVDIDILLAYPKIPEWPGRSTIGASNISMSRLNL